MLFYVCVCDGLREHVQRLLSPDVTENSLSHISSDHFVHAWLTFPPFSAIGTA